MVSLENLKKAVAVAEDLYKQVQDEYEKALRERMQDKVKKILQLLETDNIELDEIALDALKLYQKEKAKK